MIRTRKYDEHVTVILAKNRLTGRVNYKRSVNAVCVPCFICVSLKKEIAMCCRCLLCRRMSMIPERAVLARINGKTIG